eukprot:gene3346-3835_t
MDTALAGIPVIVVGGSLLLIIFKKVKVTSWCWIDLSSNTHFFLTGIPCFTLFVITLIFYALISASLRKNNDLLNPVVQRYTRLALWLSPVLLILHVMTILALAAFFSFNRRYICHYILAALYGAEGLYLIIYQCYIERMILSRSGWISPKSTPQKQNSKRQHSYSVKDTITYGDETCLEDGNDRFLIRRPSKRSLQDSSRNSISVSVGVSKKSDLDVDSDAHYFDMYGTSQKHFSGRSQRVPVVEEDELDGNRALETQLTSFDGGSMIRKKPSSHCGSVYSVESHQLTLERPKEREKRAKAAESETYDNVDIDAASSNNTRDSMDPDTISNISSELSSILKELEAFSGETSPCLNRKKEPSSGAANSDANRSPSVWQRRKAPNIAQRQNNVEMRDIHYGTVPSSTSKTDWYGVNLKDSGDGLHKCTDDLYTSF